MVKNKILKNTLALYSRQLLILIVSLYTIRITLHVLGVEGYGIYHVIVSLVALCSFLPDALVSVTQRFFSFTLGASDREKLNSTFSVNLILNGVIALIAFILLETLGYWYVKTQLNIPLGHASTVDVIYQYVTFIFITGIFTFPFIAIIISHEDMHIYAYASVSEAILKLLSALALIYIPSNKIELYGLLSLLASLINMLTYITICAKRYPECQIKKIHWDFSLLKETLSFTGWSLFGQVTRVAKNQAISLLLNQYFNPSIIAATTIANIVTSQVNIFSNSFNTGLYPQIIKLYAAEKRNEMFSLIFFGSKLTFFLMWIIALPIFIEMDEILVTWLHAPPEHTILFARLLLIEALIASISLPLASAARAPGEMKNYELTLGVIQIFVFFFSWACLSYGYSASSVFIVSIIANIFMFTARLVIVSSLIGLPILLFHRVVLCPVIFIVTISGSLSTCAKILLPESYPFSFIVIIFSAITSTITMYLFGLDKLTRKKLNAFIVFKLKR